MRHLVASALLVRYSVRLNFSLFAFYLFTFLVFALRLFTFYLFAILLLTFSLSSPSSAQTFQLHYDFRHSLDPQRNPKNYPSIVFDEWKSQDYGSFEFKTQADLSGDGNNIGELYVQAQQNLKFWEPNVFVLLEYSGGIGVVDPGGYGYHIVNAYSVGASSLFFWEGAWFSSAIMYKYSAFRVGSSDLMLSQYWGRNFFEGLVTFAGDFEVWSENRNHGDAATANYSGKRLVFYGEPQMWYNLTDNFSLGTKVNIYYHVLTFGNVMNVYPTVAVSYKF